MALVSPGSWALTAIRSNGKTRVPPTLGPGPGSSHLAPRLLGHPEPSMARGWPCRVSTPSLPHIPWGEPGSQPHLIHRDPGLYQQEYLGQDGRRQPCYGQCGPGHGSWPCQQDVRAAGVPGSAPPSCARRPAPPGPSQTCPQGVPRGPVHLCPRVHGRPHRCFLQLGWGPKGCLGLRCPVSEATPSPPLPASLPFLPGEGMAGQPSSQRSSFRDAQGAALRYPLLPNLDIFRAQWQRRCPPLARTGGLRKPLILLEMRSSHKLPSPSV